MTGPSSTGFGTTVPSALTVNSILTDWSVTTAASGTSIVGRSCDIGTRTRPNWPGVMNRSGIGEGGAHADRARGAVILVVDEVDGALQRPVLLVHELALHLDGVVARRLDLALLHQALIGHAVAFADIEGEPDRIERDDGGEQRVLSRRCRP